MDASTVVIAVALISMCTALIVSLRTPVRITQSQAEAMNVVCETVKFQAEALQRAYDRLLATADNQAYQSITAVERIREKEKNGHQVVRRVVL